MTRRDFLAAAGGLGASMALPSYVKGDPAVSPARGWNMRGWNKGLRRYDPGLVALVSDLHVNGLNEEVPTRCYEEVCFRKTVEAILALAPLPANVVCFGDIVREQDNQKVTLRI